MANKVKQRNIFCIGDSFVNLPLNDYKVWPEILAGLFPNDIIFNLGWPGVGTDVSMTTLKMCIDGVYVKNNSLKFTPDVVIFQASDFIRKTYIKEDFPKDYIDNYISFKNNNYVTWNHTPYEEKFSFRTKSITMNIGATYDKKHLKYHKKHAENFLHDIRYSWQWREPYKYIFPERDLVYVKHLCKTNGIKLINYTHKNVSKENFTDFSIENFLGEKTFKYYCVDEGYHFGTEGNTLVANIMKEKI